MAFLRVVKHIGDISTTQKAGVQLSVGGNGGILANLEVQWIGKARVSATNLSYRQLALLFNVTEGNGSGNRSPIGGIAGSFISVNPQDTFSWVSNLPQEMGSIPEIVSKFTPPTGAEADNIEGFYKGDLFIHTKLEAIGLTGEVHDMKVIADILEFE